MPSTPVASTAIEPTRMKGSTAERGISASIGLRDSRPMLVSIDTECTTRAGRPRPSSSNMAQAVL